jgi:hypothetical protein
MLSYVKQRRPICCSFPKLVSLKQSSYRPLRKQSLLLLSSSTLAISSHQSLGHVVLAGKSKECDIADAVITLASRGALTNEGALGINDS